MKILSPKTWFQKSSLAGSVISQRIVGQPVWMGRNYASFAKEAYRINAVSFRCIKLIATAAASTRLILHNSDGEKIDNHPLLDLLHHPSPNNGGAGLFEAFYSYLMIDGNSYLDAVGPYGAPPRELWVLRPDRMRVIAGKNGIPAAYEYGSGGDSVRWPVDSATGASEILHVKEFSPLNDWYGMSRVEAAAYGIDRHNAASEHNKALLDNGARPSGALIFKPVPGPGGSKNAPQEVIEAAQKELMARYTSPQNAGKPMALGGNIDWQEMGLSPKDMDFSAGKDDAARDICTAFGVPHLMIVTGSATYNNMAEAKLDLWESTIIPLVGMVIDELNSWLVPMFEKGLSLSADLDSVSALEPRREMKRKSTVDLFDKGLITVDEARGALQFGTSPVESVQKVDASVITSLLATVDAVGIEPLTKYMRSVGLIGSETTDAQIIDAATAYVGSTTP